MNLSLLTLELGVIGLALALLLIDLWTPPALTGRLGLAAAIGLLLILALSWNMSGGPPVVGCGGMFARDGLALFFKRLFLAVGVLVVLMGVEYRERLALGFGEFNVILLIALAGMMFAASANDFVLLFVAMELMSVSFYVLVSFQRSRLPSLEAGVKYLILSALAAAFLVFGIALIFGVGNTTNFAALNAEGVRLAQDKLYWLGLLMVLLGLAFKIAAFPLQMWAPDVYQGAPTPVTALLAIGSKAAGFVLLLRVLFVAAPVLAAHWSKLLMLASAVTILYGNLCAIPQRSLKRLLGYSSIANAGYLLLGISALNADGAAAVLYYLAGYSFTLAAAFAVLCIVARDSDDIGVLAGLHRRSPLLAAGLALAMVSLAGIPPLAGFLGKFLLFKAVILQAGRDPAYFRLAGVAVVGVLISLYYYFGVIRAIYWSKDPADLSAIPVSAPMKMTLIVCIGAMLYIGIFPDTLWEAATEAVKTLKF
jgi:NADH-quinone oxidoreductase subunit N